MTKTKLLQVLMSVLLGGCSSIFYHPTRFMYVPPESLKLDYKEVRFNSRDGVPLLGWHFPQSLALKRPKSFIVFFHGNAQNITSHYLNLHWIPKEGHEFFIFDYRGYGLSGIVPALYGDGERTIKPNQQGLYKDAMAALEKGYELFKKSNAEKFIVYGQSLGGAVAQRALEDFKHKEEIDLIVMDSTFASYQKIAFDKLWSIGLFKLFAPLAYILISDEYASRKFLKENKRPLLVVHGTKDPIIPFKFGKKIFEKAQVPDKKFWVLENGVHTDIFVRHGRTYQKRFLEFIEEL